MPADGRELLRVLLAEDRDVGPVRCSSLGRPSARRRSGPGRTRPRGPSPDAAGGHAALRVAVGVHLVAGRREHDVDARGGAAVATSASRVAGIAVEVLARAELQRVDEDRHDDLVGAARASRTS